MNKKDIQILGLRVDNMCKEDLLKAINRNFNEKLETIFIVTLNPEIVMNTRRNNLYKDIVNSATIILPDGVGIMMAAKILQNPLIEKMPGYEIMHDFLEEANQHARSVYFYGGEPGVAKIAANEALKLYPNMIVSGYADGYSGNSETLAHKISSKCPDYVFVATGSPRQEEWIFSHKHLFVNSVLMGVGGSLDVLSGKLKRAPDLWIRHNLEWLYRLVKQPFRAKRMMKIPVFLFLVISSYIRRKK